MAQLKKTVSVTNGSQAVTMAAGDFTDQIKKNFVFLVDDGSQNLVPYVVAADSTYDTVAKTTNFTLTGVFAGTTNPIANGVVVTDYTYPDMIPTIAARDVGTAAVFTKAMYRLQEMILAASPAGLANMQTLADQVAADKATVEADVATVATNTSTSTTAAANASTSATAASNSANSAATSASSVQALLHSFNQTWLGEHNADPTTDGNGDPLAEGVEYWNTTTHKLRVYVSGAWQDQDASVQTATTNANTAAANAAGSAAAASTSAGAASTSETNAATSATNASSSAGAAATSETNASNSAAAAATSASNASTSATNAATHEANAATSDTNAAASASTAQKWATKTDAEVVVGQGYGALKYANDAAASAAAAAASASSAAGGGVTSVNGRNGAVTLASADVGLGNVDNKSSATIRGEITSSNVTTALGFTPLSNAATTDAVAEGASNLYFTVARVRATVLTGIDLVTNAAVAATDTVMSALGKLVAKLNAHVADTTNPHAVTQAQVGLASVENKSSATIRGEITSANVTAALTYTPLDQNKVGAANGVASLDASQKVPAAQMPTTDAVAEGATNQYFSAARVRATVLTGLSTATNAVVAATNTVLEAIGLLQRQVSDNSTAIGSNATAIAGKQATLVSGTNIKTVNGASVLGAGDLVISTGLSLAQVQAAALSF